MGTWCYDVGNPRIKLFKTTEHDETWGRSVLEIFKHFIIFIIFMQKFVWLKKVQSHDNEQICLVGITLMEFLHRRHLFTTMNVCLNKRT